MISHDVHIRTSQYDTKNNLHEKKSKKKQFLMIFLSVIMFGLEKVCI